MKFLDLHTHSILSFGVDTQERMLYHAKNLGVEIGLCDGNSECRKRENPCGIEIFAKNKNELKSGLTKSNGYDYVVVHGGDEHVNRLAASDKRVDILAHPGKGRKDSGVDPFVARQAEKNNVSIEVSISTLTSSIGGSRINAIKNVKRYLMLSRKYGFDIVVTTGAKSRFDLRSGVGASQMLRLLGFDASEVESSMEAVPRGIIEKNFGETL